MHRLVTRHIYRRKRDDESGMHADPGVVIVGGAISWPTLTIKRSRKMANLKWAYALQFTYYNFCKPHMSLEKSTPAMVAGISTHIWSINELIRCA